MRPHQKNPIDVYESEWQTSVEIMKDKLLILAFDGWSNARNEPVLGVTKDAVFIVQVELFC